MLSANAKGLDNLFEENDNVHCILDVIRLESAIKHVSLSIVHNSICRSVVLYVIKICITMETTAINYVLQLALMENDCSILSFIVQLNTAT